MKALRILGLVVLAPLLPVLLLLTAIDIGVVHTVTDPTAIKRLFSESGVYTSVVPSALQHLPDIQTNVGTLPASNPVVAQAAAAAITPQVVQQNIETVLDGTYAWLDGNTTVPNFVLHLSDLRMAFANNVANAVSQRLSTLPTCVTSTEVASFDALHATCVPKGVTPAAVADQVRVSIANDPHFLEQSTITADTIKDGNGQPVFADKLRKLPMAYQRLKQTPVLLVVLTVLVGLGIVFLSGTVRRGVRHVGIALLYVAALLFCMVWILDRVLPAHVLSHITLQNDVVLQQSVRKVAADVASALGKNYLVIGSIYAIMGVIALVGVRFIKRPQVQHETPGGARLTDPAEALSPPTHSTE